MERSVLGCGKCVGKCEERIPYTLHYISLHFSQTPTHFPTSFPTPTPLVSPSHLFSHPTLPHFFHIPPILEPTTHTTKNSPILPPTILLQTLPNSLYSTILPNTPRPRTYHSYFITYPTPKFFTFLIYCQISLVQQSSALETSKFHKFKNKKWQHNV